MAGLGVALTAKYSLKPGFQAKAALTRRAHGHQQHPGRAAPSPHRGHGGLLLTRPKSEEATCSRRSMSPLSTKLLKKAISWGHFSITVRMMCLIMASYMRLNDDGRTVAAADCLVPGIGEIIGGSQREERIDVLESRIRELGMDPKEQQA